jgi:hypothetical protein
MRRRAEIFQLLASKDIDRHKMDLGVPVLSSLRSRHFDDLAGATLDHNEAVLPQSRALHGISGQAPASALSKAMLLWWLCVSEDQRRSHCAKCALRMMVGQWGWEQLEDSYLRIVGHGAKCL